MVWYPLLTSDLSCHELQGSQVHAVAQPSGFRAIVKNMAEMAVAAAAAHLSAVTEETVVRPGADVLRSDWRSEARPAGTGLGFVFRPVQIKPAGRAAVNAVLVKVGVFS